MRFDNIQNKNDQGFYYSGYSRVEEIKRILQKRSVQKRIALFTLTLLLFQFISPFQVKAYDNDTANSHIASTYPVIGNAYSDPATINGSDVYITFDKALDTTSMTNITGGNISLRKYSGEIVANASSISADHKTANFPTISFSANTAYYFRVAGDDPSAPGTQGLKFADGTFFPGGQEEGWGNLISERWKHAFTTASVMEPDATYATLPLGRSTCYNASALSGDATHSYYDITFNKPVDPNTINVTGDEADIKNYDTNESLNATPSLITSTKLRLTTSKLAAGGHYYVYLRSRRSGVYTDGIRFTDGLDIPTGYGNAPEEKTNNDFQVCTTDLTAVSLASGTLSMVDGTVHAAVAVTATPSDATNKTVTWTSSNTAVATVSASGIITAKAVGTSTITATATADPTGDTKDTLALTVTADSVAPTVSSYFPVDNSLTVSPTGNLKLTFHETLVAQPSKNITIYAGGVLAQTIAANNTSVVTVYVNPDTTYTTVTINPPEVLADETDYYINIAAGAFKDLAGNDYAGISDATTWNFHTAALTDTTRPAVSSLSPADNATGVSVSANLVITFGEEVINQAGRKITIKKADNTTVETIDANDSKVSVAGGTVTVNPTNNFLPNTDYYVLLDTGAFEDAAGNTSLGYALSTQWNFKTLADTTDPVVSAFTMGTVNGLAVAISTFTATDNIGVAGYKITTSSTPPTASSTGWTTAKPTSYSVTSTGTKILYPWVKDSSGNVSAVFASPRQVIFTAAAPDSTHLSTAVPGDGRVVLDWNIPDDNGSAITNYKVEYKAHTSSIWLTFSHTASTTSGLTVTGLTNGTNYDFRVSAINGIGNGTLSNTLSATPAASAAHDIESGKLSVSKGGATLVFSALPAGSTWLDITVNDGIEHPAPTGEKLEKTYSITATNQSGAVTSLGNATATVTLNTGGNKVLYWNGSSWANTGITLGEVDSSSVRFATTHFTDFGVFTGTNALPTKGILPVTGSNMINLLLNILLSALVYVFLINMIKRSKFSRIFS